MTDFEKILLAHSIVMCKDVTESIETILKAVNSEDCGHMGDNFESATVDAISKYLHSISNESKRIDNLIEEEIVPQIQTGNYINTISIIEHFERSVN